MTLWLYRNVTIFSYIIIFKKQGVKIWPTHFRSFRFRTTSSNCTSWHEFLQSTWILSLEGWVFGACWTLQLSHATNFRWPAWSHAAFGTCFMVRGFHCLSLIQLMVHPHDGPLSKQLQLSSMKSSQIFFSWQHQKVKVSVAADFYAHTGEASRAVMCRMHHGHFITPALSWRINSFIASRFSIFLTGCWCSMII